MGYLQGMSDKELGIPENRDEQFIINLKNTIIEILSKTYNIKQFPSITHSAVLTIETTQHIKNKFKCTKKL